jgi:transposase
MQVTTIGLDIAKNVFQVHGIDSSEKVVVRKRLRRGQVLAFFNCDLRHLVDPAGGQALARRSVAYYPRPRAHDRHDW